MSWGWLRVGLTSLTALAVVAGSASPAGLAPLHPDEAGPQAAAFTVAIERPARDLTVAGSVLIDGWAADAAAASGTGVDGVDLYLDNTPDGGGTQLGPAEYGRQRDDIATQLGDARFGPTGFRYRWALDGVAPGPHAVFAVARGSGGTVSSTSVPITVSDRACLPQVVLDNLTPNATVTAAMTVTGYAADPGSRDGTGVTALALYLDAAPADGGTLVATATYGAARPEAVTAYGEDRFAASGFSLDWDPSALPEGAHNLYFVATGTCGDVATPLPLLVARPGSGQTAVSATTPATAPGDSGGCITVKVTTPTPGMTVNPPLVVTGSAYNAAATSDTGASKVTIFNGPKDNGGTAIGEARYGLIAKPIADTLGQRFASSGYSATLNTPLPNGALTLYVYATGSCGEGWRSIPVTVDSTLPAGAAVAPAGSQPPATTAPAASATPTPAASAAPGAAPSSANAPQPPTNVQVTAAGASATLTWGASPGGNVRDYTIWQSTDGATFTQVQTKGSGDTSHTFSSLNPSTVYYYFVVARNQAGDTSARSNVAGPVVLSGGQLQPPANVQVTVGSGNTLSVTWSKSGSANVTGYYIFLGRDNTTPVQYTQTGADATSAQVPLQNPGNTYTLYVTAVAGTQQSGPSNILGPCAVGSACTTSTSTGSSGGSAPTTGLGLPGTAGTSTGTGTAPSSGTGTTTPATTAQATPSTGSGGLFGLPGTGTGSVSTSTTQPAATSTGAPVAVPTPATGTIGAPAAPANLTASVQNANTVLLSWTAPSTGAPTNYQIFQAVNNGQYTSAGYVSGSSTQAQLPNLSPGTSYTFYVTAVNGSTSSAQSNVAGPVSLTSGVGTVAGVGPTNVQVSFPAGANYATVTWAPVVGYNVAYYRVAWQGATGSNQQMVPANQTAGAQYSYTIQGLVANQSYTVTVTAVDSANNQIGQAATAYASPGSSGAVATGFLTAPTLTAQAQSNRRVLLSWSQVAGATGYRIYRDGNFVFTTPATQLTYTDQITSGAVGSATYFVVAINASSQEGQRSNTQYVNLLP